MLHCQNVCTSSPLTAICKLVTEGDCLWGLCCHARCVRAQTRCCTSKYHLPVAQLLHHCLASGSPAGASICTMWRKEVYIQHALSLLLAVQTNGTCSYARHAMCIAGVLSWNTCLTDNCNRFQVGLLEDCNLCAIHAKRVTVM